MPARRLVSVIMPVFDGARHVAAAVESIQAQTYRHLELIVVDNESTDDSAAIVEEIARGDQRIRLVTGVSGDRARAKNVGIQHARGELVARMDADDIAVPERLAVQLDWLRRTRADVCGGWVSKFGAADGLGWFPEEHEAIERELLFRSPLIGPTVMAPRAVFESHPYSERAVFKDYELWTRLVTRCRLTNVPAVLLRYRGHPRQTSVLEASERREELLRLSATLFRRLHPDAGDDDARVVGLVVAREPFEAVGELERAGAWLVRLAESPDPMLRRGMLQRWREACRRSAHLGPAVYRSYVRLASEFGVAEAGPDPRLRAACALRARSGSRRDRGLRGLRRTALRVRG